jgi:hypothetical protein
MRLHEKSQGQTCITLFQNANLVSTMELRLGDGALGLLASSDMRIAGDRIAAIGQGLDGARPAQCLRSGGGEFLG